MNLKTAVRLGNAVAEAQRLRAEISKFDSTRSNRMTARGFLREALTQAGLTLEEAKDLRRRVEALETQRHPGIARFLVRARAWIAEGTTTRPPREARRLTWIAGPELELELPLVQTSVFGLFAVATLAVVETMPAVAWGVVEDWDQHTARLEKLKEQLRALAPPLREELDRRRDALREAEEALRAVEGR